MALKSTDDLAGFLAYLFVLGLSCVAWAFGQGGGGSLAIAISLFLWGVLALRRASMFSGAGSVSASASYEQDHGGNRRRRGGSAALPARLLYGLGLKNARHYESVLDKIMARESVVLLLMLAGTAALWGMASMFFPAEAPAAKIFLADISGLWNQAGDPAQISQAGQEARLAFPAVSAAGFFGKFSLWLSIGLCALLGLSYSGTRTYGFFMVFFAAACLPVIFIGGILQVGMTESLPLIRGAGLNGVGPDTARLLIGISPEMAYYYSPLLRRTLEFGLTGALLSFMTIFAATAIYMHAILAGDRVSLFSYCGVGVCLALVTFDMFSLTSAMTEVFWMLSAAAGGFCLGQALRESRVRYMIFQAV